jgi:hypothetical protein
MWENIDFIVLAVFIVLAALSYLVPRFITGPRTGLSRLLGDGAAAGLRPANAAERERLDDLLRAELGGWERTVQLGAAYRARDSEAYVFEMGLAGAESAKLELRYERQVRLFLAEVDLLDGFRLLFAVYSAAPGVEPISPVVQEILLREAEAAHPWSPFRLGNGEVVLAPGFVALDLETPPKRIEHVRAALDFAHLLRQASRREGGQD